VSDDGTLYLRFPDGRTTFSVGGQVYDADPAGGIRVPAEHLTECLRHGLVPAPEPPGAGDPAEKRSPRKSTKPTDTEAGTGA